AGGDVEESPDVSRVRGLQQVEEPVDVDRGIEPRVGNRAADVDLRGMMADEIEPASPDEIGEGGVADIALDELDVVWEVRTFTRRGADHGHDGVASLGERGGDMRADETGRAGHENGCHSASTDRVAGVTSAAES